MKQQYLKLKNKCHISDDNSIKLYLSKFDNLVQYMQISMEQLLRFLNTHNRSVLNPVSYKPKEYVVSQEQCNNYPIQIKCIYDHLFNDRKNKIQFEKVLPFQFKKTKVPLCNKSFELGTPVYKCYECCIHEAAVLCAPCFQAGQHSGHRFKKFDSGGGNCDCGNDQALKPEGFCRNHSGKVQIPQISQVQQQEFFFLISTIFQWIFILKYRNESFYQTLAILIAEYLTKLNVQSIHYNILTYRVLTKEYKNKNCFISEIFKINNNPIASKYNQLFFQMFALDDFKTILADRYLDAYNTVQKFEKTPFHSLYIQLFANDKIVIELTQKRKKTIHVTKLNYDIEVYLEDIHFISSLRDEPAFSFYQAYLQKNGCVPFKILDQIEEKFEKTQDMHQVDLVSTYLRQQNLYYVQQASMIKKLSKNSGLLRVLAKGLYNMIISGKHSYNKNKALLPYHRVFAECLFTLFNGKIEQMNKQTISDMLQVSQSDVMNFYSNYASQVLNCLLEFSETYARRSYFDNYTVLYARSGIICINYDFLFIKQAASVFKGDGKDLSHIIEQIFNKDYSIFLKKSRQQTLQQFISKWMYFYEFMIEISVSDIPDIIMNQRLQVENKQIVERQNRLFLSILKKLGQITEQDKAVIQRFFTYPIGQNFLSEATLFNKQTKKYSLAKNKQQNTKIRDFCYQIYISKRKTGQMLLKQQEQPFLSKNNKQNDEANNQIVQKLKIILPLNIIYNFIEFVKKAESQIIENSIKNKLFRHFMSILNKLSIFDSNQGKYIQIQEKIKKALASEEMIDQLETQNKNNLRKQRLKQKMNEKKAKFLQKQNRAIQKLQVAVNQNKEQSQGDLSCILCRDKQQSNENLCYFANLKHKRLTNCRVEKGKYKFVYIYNSCFHTTHYSCFSKLSKESLKFNCPLCKTPCNIVLPVSADYFSQTFKQSMTKIYNMITLLKLKHRKNSKEQIQISQFDKQLIFQSMMQSMIEHIGISGLFNPSEFERKLWRICKQLLKILSLMWNSFSGNQKQNLYQKFGKQLQQFNSQQLKQSIKIFNTIKHCVLSCIFNAIQGRQFQGRIVMKMYSQKVSNKDFQIIRNNLQLVLGNNSMSQQYQQIPQNKILPVKDYLSYYMPPQTVKQLIAKRDVQTAKLCKPGHNVHVCCQCQQVVCKDCRTLYAHSKTHGSESIYFSLLTGSVLLITMKSLELASLYENKFGMAWTAQRQPQGFILNKEYYKEIMENFMFNSISEYFLRKPANLINANQIFIEDDMMM